MRTILVTLVMPWRASRVVSARQSPLRARYFLVVGLLLVPALFAGSCVGHALRERHEVRLVAPQANLIATLARGVTTSEVPAWRVAAGVCAVVVGGLGAGAILVVFSAAVLGFLLRDRSHGRSLGFAATIVAPVLSLAAALAIAADVLWARGAPRDWPDTILAGLVGLYAVTGCGLVAWGAAKQVSRPRVPPGWTAIAFAILSLVTWRIANEVLFLPATLLQLGN